MEPTSLQRLFAQDWIWPRAFWGLSFVASVALGWLVYWHEGNIWVAALLGAVFGVVGGTALLVWTDRCRARINGAPFFAGDSVRILSGRYKDQVATVDVVWKSQLRVDLGEEARLEQRDVFSFVEVCREDEQNMGEKAF